VGPDHRGDTCQGHPDGVQHAGEHGGRQEQNAGASKHPELERDESRKADVDSYGKPANCLRRLEAALAAPASPLANTAHNIYETELLAWLDEVKRRRCC
jgi:hypothetical protein